MPSFHYKARDKQGKPVEGTQESDSPKSVAMELERRGLLPIDIVRTAEQAGLPSLFPFGKRIKFEDVNVFTRQLLTLQKAGIPILNSLQVAQLQSSSPAFRTVIEKVMSSIESGENFSAALGRHPLVFNSVYVPMIHAGEVSGRLTEVLDRLVAFREKEARQKMKIQAALRYPVIVLCALTVAFIILTTFVVPRFAKLYSQSTVPLPLPTKILLAVSTGVSQYWWVLLLLALGVLGIFRNGLKTTGGRARWDAFILRIPVIGPLVMKLVLARVCRVLGIMITSGVPILQILDLITTTADNAVVAAAFERIKISVNAGKGMTEPMRTSGIFPPLVVQLVAIGEETGKLDELMAHVADYYDDQVDYTIANLTALIEPALIVVLAAGVGLMALAIFMPMWNLMDVLRHRS